MHLLLDTFCKAGGCTKGYQQAGFYVVGVDIEPQPRYVGNEFYQGDAIKFIEKHGHEFDAIHASPPCQAYSKSKHLATKDHPELIETTRRALRQTGKHYVIENVPGAPLQAPIFLSGQMFGLMVDRERWFETSFPVPFQLIPPPRAAVKMGRPVQDGQVIQVVGHFSNVPYARKAMGINWMTQRELAQAIPPAYTEYIGRYLFDALNAGKET